MTSPRLSPRPRDVRLTAAGRLVTALGVLFVLGGFSVGAKLAGRFDDPPALRFIAGALFAGAGLFCFDQVRRQLGFLSEGRTATAKVTGVTKKRRSHSSENIVEYEFVLLNGVTVRAKSTLLRKPPGVGAVIGIVYDSEEPRRSRPLPLALAKPGWRI